MATPIQKWRDYQPSKAVWLWSCAACIILTVIVGFSAFGWTTAGSATAMAEDAAAKASERIVASICVDRFVSAPDAAANLVELKEADSWDRDTMIREGGWIEIGALEKQISDAADVCASRLVAMEGLPARVVGENTEATNG